MNGQDRADGAWTLVRLRASVEGVLLYLSGFSILFRLEVVRASPKQRDPLYTYSDEPSTES